MTEHLFPRAYARLARWLCAAVCLPALALAAGAQGLPPGSPVLLTEGTGQTTRAVAYEAVTGRSEPFPVVSAVNWNADSRTRATSNARDALRHGAPAARGRGRERPDRRRAGRLGAIYL